MTSKLCPHSIKYCGNCLSMSGFPTFLHLLAPRLRPGTRHHRPRLTEPWTKPRHRDDDLQTLHYLSGILRCHYGKIWHNFVYSLPKKCIFYSIIDFFHQFYNLLVAVSNFSEALHFTLICDAVNNHRKEEMQRVSVLTNPPMKQNRE